MWRWVFGITAGLIGLYIVLRLVVGPLDVDHAHAVADTATAIGHAANAEVSTTVDSWDRRVDIILSPDFPLQPEVFAQNLCQAGSTTYDWSHPWLLQVFAAPTADSPIAACYLR